MSSRYGARAVLRHRPMPTAVRRFSMTSLRRAPTEDRQPGPEATASPPSWSGRGVLAVALAAGAIGWGASTLMSKSEGLNPFNGSKVLFDADSEPRYASMFEMEQVCFNFLLNSPDQCHTDSQM